MGLPGSLTAMRKGDIAVLRLLRPAMRNALDVAMLLGMQTFFQQIPADIRAVVLHGEGAHFSAGLDASAAVRTIDPDRNMVHSQMWKRVFQDVQFGRVPVVSVLHGAVIGGGLELAASTHIRIAEQSTFYALPEEQHRSLLSSGNLERITRLIGVARVQDMMLTGRILSAEEGQTVGISQYLVDNGQGLAKAIELAAKIAINVP